MNSKQRNHEEQHKSISLSNCLKSKMKRKSYMSFWIYAFIVFIKFRKCAVIISSNIFLSCPHIPETLITQILRLHDVVPLLISSLFIYHCIFIFFYLFLMFYFGWFYYYIFNVINFFSSAMTIYCLSCPLYFSFQAL